MQLSRRNRFLMGLTVFSMFFGAGNLIFPPFMAALAGKYTWIAMIGLTLSAVCLPIMGVVAIAKSDGLDKLAGRVHPVFASILTFLIYMSIGPCLAIPRTASTSFAMAVPPFIDGDHNIAVLQLVYSVVFFTIAYIIALRPDKLTQRLGKILSPILLILIATLFIGTIVNPPAAGYGPVLPPYTEGAATEGFIYGYQTMDTIAALNFGLIIALNISALGVKDKDSIVKESINAGIIAGALLLIVYSALAHVGAVSGNAFPGSVDGTQTLTNIIGYLFGPAGKILIAATFIIACLNTCICLISCCSNYFCTLMPKVSYKVWAAVFAIVSMIISNAGLGTILKISVPVLNAIYPIAIVLILLSFVHRLDTHRGVYIFTILFTGIISVSEQLPFLKNIVKAIPLGKLGFAWVIPAIIGFAIGFMVDKAKAKA